MTTGDLDAGALVAIGSRRGTTKTAHPRHIETARRNQEHRRNGTVDQSPGVFRVPVWKYTDVGRWQQEMDRIFRRVPLMLALGGELREPGSYKAMMALDVPLLITRGDDGVARTFVNMCSHRGAIVVEEGHGTRRRFACPYHNWTYDDRGALVSVTDRRAFGEVDTECLGLTALPTAEKAGLVFATLTPGTSIDIDVWLQGYDEVLEWLDLGSTRVVASTELEGPGWKVAYDGYTDFYHLPFLHRSFFGADAYRTASYDFWGPHQRVTTPASASTLPTPVDQTAELDNTPLEEWPIDVLAGGIYAMFPNISIFCGSRGGSISQLWPGPTPDRSRTIQYYLVAGDATEEERVDMLRSAEVLDQVVGAQDYWMGERVQTALKTGTKADMLFGRNEGGGRHFHSWVNRLVAATTDVELKAALETG